MHSVRAFFVRVSFAATLCSLLPVIAAAQPTLPGAAPLSTTDDLSAAMVAGIGRFLDGESRESVNRREQFWQVDFSSRDAYEKSIAPNRARLAKILGVVDPRVTNVEMEYVSSVTTTAKVAETDRFTVFAVRGPAIEGVCGEGLLLQPKGDVRGRVIALPDADQTPEMLAGLGSGIPASFQFARKLADQGCQVIVPTLIDRSDTSSGSVRFGRTTNQPGREWIYRQAYEMGRHVIGYEVQKVMAAVDWLERLNRSDAKPIGVAGWGEGGLIAFYAAALDPRIQAAAVSGYFGPREALWQEPIYRNVFGLLREFGDAEVARLIAPRALLIDSTQTPEVSGPPAPRPRFTGAAPGRIATPPLDAIKGEVERARRLTGTYASGIQFVSTGATVAGGVSDGALEVFLPLLGVKSPALLPIKGDLHDARAHFSVVERQQRQVRELEQFTQRLIPRSRDLREDFLWKKAPATTPAAWQELMRPYREKFWNEVIGRYAPTVPAQPRSRVLFERPTWTAHEVVLDVMPDVFAWGYLLVPKGMAPGEKRPVVVVQHGLEGVPGDTITEDQKLRAYGTYKAFGARLVERGFIVFAPHNPYRGEDAFRLLQRRANPLGKSLFSFIIAQHERILDWLVTQPNVDPNRIGFYGLSYGGKTAMRVPAVLERYALSICSGDFNEWVYKNATTEWDRSYMFSKEWEMPEWDLGSTFNYAEMAALIAPRPFMVERGHDDGVSIDEWVAFEYSKVKRLYDRLKIPERTELEFFVGPHTIHGVGTFKFLHQNLNWPEPK